MHTEDDENYRQDDEAHELNGFTAPRVDEQEGKVVPREQTSGSQNKVTRTDVIQGFVDTAGSLITRWGKTDRIEHNGRVETQAIESDLKKQAK
jgi:hypothetical protein